MQTRLQHELPPLHASPSTEQPPTPPVGSAEQVPAVLPAGIVHRLVQQSEPRKQMSPVT